MPAGLLDVGDGIKVLTNQLAQNASTRTVQNTNTAQADEDSIVDEVHHRIDSFVTTHASHVKVLVEVLSTVLHCSTCHVTGLNGQMGMLVGRGSWCRCFAGALQLFQ